MRTKKALRVAAYSGSLALVTILFAGAGQAQDAFVGKFTLSSEAYWGRAVLEPGDYTISMPSTAPPAMLFVRGQNKAAIIFAVGSDTKTVSNRSQLTLEDVDGKYVVRRLEVGDLGLVFDYRVPKSKTTHIAWDQDPMLRIPVSGGGK